MLLTKMSNLQNVPTGCFLMNEGLRILESQDQLPKPWLPPGRHIDGHEGTVESNVYQSVSCNPGERAMHG